MVMHKHLLFGLLILAGTLTAAAHAEDRTLQPPTVKLQQLKQMPTPATDPLAVQKQANSKAANEVRATMQEIIRFQQSTWQGERVCEDSRLRWKTLTIAGATAVPKEIWDCAPFACDAAQGTCRASCDAGAANSCATGAECLMTGPDGHNGICVSKN